MTDRREGTNTPAARSTTPGSARATAAAAVTVLLWASAFVVIRSVGHTFSPAPMALIRLVVAAAALTLLVVITRRRASRRRPLDSGRPAGLPAPRSLALIALYGVLWLAGYTVALNAAEQHVDAGTAALLVNVAPLLVAFGAGALLGEGYPRTLLMGSVVALAGVGLIAVGSSGRNDSLGVALCLLAAVLYAVGVLIQKVTLRDVDGLTATWLACVAGALALSPWALQLVGEVQEASTAAILGAGYLGLFPTAIGFSTWAYALRRMDAGRLTATTYAVPAVSVILAWLLLSETPTVFGFAGGAICLLGVAVSRRRPRTAAAPGERPTPEARPADAVDDTEAASVR